VMARLVPYLPLNPLLPRPKGDKDAEGMKKQIPSNNTILIDGQGHPYIDGSEGTNASEASAEIVRKGERPGYVH